MLVPLARGAYNDLVPSPSANGSRGGPRIAGGMSRFGIVFMIVLGIYLAYRFWWMGYQFGESMGWSGPLVAATTCLSLLAFAGGGLWWATRQGPRKGGPSGPR